VQSVIRGLREIRAEGGVSRFQGLHFFFSATGCWLGGSFGVSSGAFSQEGFEHVAVHGMGGATLFVVEGIVVYCLLEVRSLFK
jgi:hypothetical protein